MSGEKDVAAGRRRLVARKWIGERAQGQLEGEKAGMIRD
jgi:hypothetical protein